MMRAIYDYDAICDKFTGKERDAETGLDYVGARYYGSNMGRFTSPDPKMLSSQRLYDPQQWNMYQYGRNNPTTMIDPDGREVKIATQELQKSFDRLMKSEKLRNGVAPYQGKNNPDLIIGRGKLGFDPMEPTRKELGVTKPSIVPVIHNCSSATNCTDIPAKLKSTTITIITIDDSVKEGKGKEQGNSKKTRETFRMGSAPGTSLTFTLSQHPSCHTDADVADESALLDLGGDAIRQRGGCCSEGL